MVGGRKVAENFVETSSANPSLIKRAGETSYAQPQIKALGRTTSGCSSCFGRIITASKRLSAQESMISSHGLRCKKSRCCRRKFSCVSSCDVLPTVTSSAATMLDKHVTAHTINHKAESLNGIRNSKTALITSAGSLMHKKLCRGLGRFLREKATTKAGQLSPEYTEDSEPAVKIENWCLMMPALMKSDLTISNNTPSHVSSALQMSSSERNIEQDPSRPSKDSCEISLMSMRNGETSPQKLGRNVEVSTFYDRESSPIDSGEGSNISTLLVNHGLSGSSRSFGMRNGPLSSSVFSRTSAGRTMGVPFLFGLGHRTRSLEMISSPSSDMSSPDVHLSNPDFLHSYASTRQNPYLSTAAFSPDYHESYHLRSSLGTPVLTSFRQFPLQPFDEGQECGTYGGISEQQVFMWEANLIFGGIPVQDQFRDLRLDIDSMSYEDLLALEERIGNVCTGLEKDSISSCLRKKQYLASSDYIFTKEVSELKCSICQVDFEDGTELGTLKCGHNHHFQCIEQWLLRKNQCPICKTSAFTKCEA